MIIELEDDADHFIAFQKVAMFINPDAGKASYGEIVRSVKALEKYLIDKGEGQLMGHGGARRGEGYDKTESIKTMIANILEKSDDTVTKHLSHGKYLSEDCLKLLADEHAPRSFFRHIEKSKVDTIDKNAESEQLIDIVSEFVLSEWKKFSNGDNQPEKAEISNEDKQPEQAEISSHDSGIEVDQTGGEEMAKGLKSGQEEKSVPVAAPSPEDNSPEVDDPDHQDESEVDGDNIGYTYGGETDTESIDSDLLKIGERIVSLSKEQPDIKKKQQKLEDIIVELTVLVGKLDN